MLQGQLAQNALYGAYSAHTIVIAITIIIIVIILTVLQ